MTKRTLALKREALTELSTADLGRVAGADQYDPSITCPIRECIRNTQRVCVQTENCPTLFC